VGPIGLLVWVLRAGPPPRPMVTRQFTFTGKATETALSPDGSSLAYVSGGRALVVQALHGGEPRTLVSDARFIYAIRWTRNGFHLVFIMFRDSTELAATYSVPVGGGTPRKIVDDQTEFDTGPDTASIIRKPLGFAVLEVRSIQTGELRRTIPLPDSLGE